MIFLFNIAEAYNEYRDRKFYITYYNPDKKIISPLFRYGYIVREVIKNIFGDEEIQWSIVLDDETKIHVRFKGKASFLCSEDEYVFKMNHRQISIDLLDEKIESLEYDLKQLKKERKSIDEM